MRSILTERELTEREQEAVTWAKANYTHWRKRFGEMNATEPGI